MKKNNNDKQKYSWQKSKQMWISHTHTHTHTHTGQGPHTQNRISQSTAEKAKFLDLFWKMKQTDYVELKKGVCACVHLLLFVIVCT